MRRTDKTLLLPDLVAACPVTRITGMNEHANAANAGKIPVIRDRDADLVLTESDAILLYLADKVGRLVPASGRERIRALELLFDFDQHPSLQAWFERVGARPAVARGVTIPRPLPQLPPRKRA